MTAATPDVVTRVTPLGVRLWDLATGAPAEEGTVMAFRRAAGPPVVAARTPSGVHALRGLPGLGAAERGAGDAAYWYQPPASGSYRVEISDPQARYLPFCLDVLLPAHGLYRPSCAFPELQAPVVPVFSGPARAVPGGCAAIRAQLELDTGGPASWARLDATLPDGTVARGMADGAGRVAVLFPYPELPAPATPLAALTWLVRLDAYYGAGSPRRAAADGDQPPELCDALRQAPVRLLADGAQTLTEASLRFGHELVLRTAGRSTLLLTGSP
jgi:hypothetical protein